MPLEVRCQAVGEATHFPPMPFVFVVPTWFHHDELHDIQGNQDNHSHRGVCRHRPRKTTRTSIDTPFVSRKQIFQCVYAIEHRYELPVSPSWVRVRCMERTIFRWVYAIKRRYKTPGSHSLAASLSFGVRMWSIPVTSWRRPSPERSFRPRERGSFDEFMWSNIVTRRRFVEVMRSSLVTRWRSAPPVEKLT